MGCGMLSWLDEEEQVRLEEEVKSYEAFPLERRDTLEWKGPSLFPLSTAELTSTNNCRRSVLSSLLGPGGPCHSSNTGWSLELVEPLKVGQFGEYNHNQIWRGRVHSSAGDDSERHHVVVKFYYDGVFFHRDGKMGPPGQKYYTDGDGLAENEAMAYDRLKSLQGLDVPLCYGFFEFVVPSGHTVIGSVLEDLTGCMKSIQDHAKQLRRRYKSPVEYTNQLNPILLRCYRALDRIHQQRVAFTAFLDETSFFLSKVSSYSADPPTEIVIIMGFSHARCTEDTDEWKEGGEDWVNSDRAHVTCSLRNEFGTDFDRELIWYKRAEEGRELEDLDE